MRGVIAIVIGVVSRAHADAARTLRRAFAVATDDDARRSGVQDVCAMRRGVARDAVGVGADGGVVTGGVAGVDVTSASRGGDASRGGGLASRRARGADDGAIDGGGRGG